jgi:hypothetical protein
MRSSGGFDGCAFAGLPGIFEIKTGAFGVPRAIGRRRALPVDFSALSRLAVICLSVAMVSSLSFSYQRGTF